ncbi:MAG: hypothetical protein EBS87_11555 [Sphingomonadaceae bacterium]|nr:hypothetical protein [Sphingomonadaceae bacterium]
MLVINTADKQTVLGLKVCCLLLMAALAGCATPARIEEMSIHSSRLQSQHAPLRNAIAVTEVTGGRETNAMWTSQVSSEAFRRALEMSLRNTGLSDPLVSANKYHLTADILQVNQPLIGIDITVTANIRYSLIEASTRKEIFSKIISANYTAKFSDAFAGAERLRLANEGAAKANIQMLTDELLRLRP